ncbi:MAG: C13 family peptidase [Spirochaetota bacterium]|nr:C13 family peptidase [Spirochaetota bacterium]
MRNKLAFILIILSSLGLNSLGSGNNLESPRALNWKFVVMTGDNSIKAFDNARRDIRDIFVDYGVKPQNIRELSSSRKEQRLGARPSTVKNLRKTLVELDIGQDDGCVIYLTSHGTKQGFYVRRDRFLTPKALSAILDETCGDRPTVVIVSACFSGIFAEPVMRRSNRIILTAASKDRPSFGCGTKDQYNYFDGCFIKNLPRSFTWTEMAANSLKCVQRKERLLKALPSNPQAFFGSDVAELSLLNSFSPYKPVEKKENIIVAGDLHEPELPSEEEDIHELVQVKSKKDEKPDEQEESGDDNMENQYWDDGSGS